MVVKYIHVLDLLTFSCGIDTGAVAGATAGMSGADVGLGTGGIIAILGSS